MNDELSPQEQKQEQQLKDSLQDSRFRLETHQRERLFDQLESRSRRKHIFIWTMPALGATAALLLAFFMTQQSPDSTPKESIIVAVHQTEGAPSDLEWDVGLEFTSQFASARSRLDRISPSQRTETRLFDGRISTLRSNIQSLRTRIN